jgi:tight adherence protein B
VCPDHRAELADWARAWAEGRDPPVAAPALRSLAHAWSVAAATGAPLADVVRRVADDLAARIEQRHGVAAAVAGARSSALLLAGLPALGLLLGAAMQAHPLDVLVRTPAGRLLGLVGVTLDALGVLWTQLLIARSERT